MMKKEEMSKEEAEKALELLNRVGRQLGYKDITVTGHLLADIERFLILIPKGDPESGMRHRLDTILLALGAVRITSIGFYNTVTSEERN